MPETIHPHTSKSYPLACRAISRPTAFVPSCWKNAWRESLFVGGASAQRCRCSGTNGAARGAGSAAPRSLPQRCSSAAATRMLAVEPNPVAIRIGCWFLACITQWMCFCQLRKQAALLLRNRRGWVPPFTSGLSFLALSLVIAEWAELCAQDLMSNFLS